MAQLGFKNTGDRNDRNDLFDSHLSCTLPQCAAYVAGSVGGVSLELQTHTDKQLHSSSGRLITHFRNRDYIDYMRASKAVALSSGTSRSEPFSVRRWIWQPWSKTWLDNLYSTTRTSSNSGQRDCLFVFLQIQKTSNVNIVSAKDVWKSKSWNTQTS